MAVYNILRRVSSPDAWYQTGETFDESRSEVTLEDYLAMISTRDGWEYTAELVP